MKTEWQVSHHGRDCNRVRLEITGVQHIDSRVFAAVVEERANEPASAGTRAIGNEQWLLHDLVIRERVTIHPTAVDIDSDYCVGVCSVSVRRRPQQFPR